MYQGNNYYPGRVNQVNKGYQNMNDDRIIGGGFLGPFILGGITGGIVAPYFYGRPYPYPPMPYRPYPMYPPYPPRW